METRKSIIEKLNYEFSQRRAYAIAIADNKREEWSGKLPALNDLDSRIRLYTVKENRAFIEDDESAYNEFRTLKEQAKKDYWRLLKDQGVTEEDFKPKFRCKTCEDTGLVEGKQCACYQNELLARLYKQLNIDGAEGESFEQFDLGVFPEQADSGGVSQRSQMKKLYSYTLHFCDEFPQNKELSVILFGAAGLGKTYLINCIGKRVLNRGYSVLKLTAFRLMEIFKAHHLNKDENNYSINDLLNIDLLLIDDLGTEPTFNNITLEYLSTLINERLVNKKHTIISTNLTPKDIRDRYGERILSRIAQSKTGVVIHLTGKDIRKIK